MEVRSTLAMNTLLSSRMTATQGQIQRIEQQVASGKKADTFAQLGTEAGIDIALHNEANSIATYQVNNKIIAGRLSAMDQSMIAIHDVTESVKSDAYALMPSDAQRGALIDKATAAFNTVVNALQVSVGGRSLFSGEKTDTLPVDPDVMTTLKANIALLPNPLDATAVEAEISNFFSTTGNFYQGGSLTTATAIDQNLSIDYNIVASDPAFRTTLQGLATIALAPKPDGTNTTDAQYATVVANTASLLSAGVGGVNALISSNGNNQALVETTNTQHEATLTLVGTQINTLEETDMTTAATQLALLRTQLEATYAMTSQINELSLVNYLK